MTTTQTDTVTERLKWDTTLRAFLQTWWEEREIPVPLIDYLIESEMGSAAECVRWMAEQPRRLRGGESFDLRCPTPYDFSAKWGDFGWEMIDGPPRMACQLPHSLFDFPSDGFVQVAQFYAPTAVDAIAKAIDHWRQL